MNQTPEKPEHRDETASVSRPARKRRRSRLRKLLIILSIVAIPLIVARLALPSTLRWYVNRTLDKSEIYEGRIGDIDVHLWRGAYTINDVRLIKRAGDVPVPFFTARRIDLGVQWNNLLHRKVVGRIKMDHPTLNFVDAPIRPMRNQARGPGWKSSANCSRFKSTVPRSTRRRFTFAYQVNPPVNIYLSHINGTIDDLTNVYNQVTPLYATVNATGMAMDQANFQFKMKLDPFSYRPSFDMGVRLIGLDVRKINQFAARRTASSTLRTGGSIWWCRLIPRRVLSRGTSSRYSGTWRSSVQRTCERTTRWRCSGRRCWV